MANNPRRGVKRTGGTGHWVTGSSRTAARLRCSPVAARRANGLQKGGTDG
jgi:hypothetical protein